MKNHTISLLAIAVMAAVAAGCGGAADTKWYSGNPDAASFCISSAEELAGLAKIVNGTWYGKPRRDDFSGRTVSLAGDIDLSRYRNWTPIGGKWDSKAGERAPFSGTFDGGGHTVSNLTCKRPRVGIWQGLFGIVEGGQVVNLRLSGVNISAVAISGSVAGQLVNGILADCHAAGAVSGNGLNIGGIAGAIFEDSRITGSGFSGTVSGRSGGSPVGGVVGSVMTNSRVTGSYFEGTVDCGAGYAGGVAGILEENGMVENSYSAGAVTGGDVVGGVAGFIGNNSIAANSYSAAAVSGRELVGGIAGKVSENSRVENCYATGEVVGQDYVGGIAGGIVSSSSVAGSAALNAALSVAAAVENVGRVAGQTGDDGTDTLSGNAAYAGMMCVSLGWETWPEKGAAEKDGADVTAGEIAADPAMGGRFSEAGGWTLVPGSLPGLGGKAVDMPAHLRPGHGGALGDIP
ncbi:MAG: hypothetical protein FWC23_08790 [Chitinispirillia bacterium]|nr:hypothetical protein [Chitinispirillia bacterium]MCL2269265.1 hypothetical protein [Chitinispirillia bacterium]